MCSSVAALLSSQSWVPFPDLTVKSKNNDLRILELFHYNTRLSDFPGVIFQDELKYRAPHFQTLRQE